MSVWLASCSTYVLPRLQKHGHQQYFTNNREIIYWKEEMCWCLMLTQDDVIPFLWRFEQTQDIKVVYMTHWTSTQTVLDSRSLYYLAECTVTSLAAGMATTSIKLTAQTATQRWPRWLLNNGMTVNSHPYKHPAWYGNVLQSDEVVQQWAHC